MQISRWQRVYKQYIGIAIWWIVDRITNDSFADDRYLLTYFERKRHNFNANIGEAAVAEWI